MDADDAVGSENGLFLLANEGGTASAPENICGELVIIRSAGVRKIFSLRKITIT